MRTTVDLPSELMRTAKAKAAGRGEALKTLFQRAVTRELTQSASPVRQEHAAWPLIRSKRRGKVRLTNDDLARIESGDDRPKSKGRRR